MEGVALVLHSRKQITSIIRGAGVPYNARGGTDVQLHAVLPRLFIEAHQGQSSRLQNPRGTRANEIFRNPLSFERSARLSARTLLRSPVYKHKQPGHVRNAAPQQLTTGDSTHIILDGES